MITIDMVQELEYVAYKIRCDLLKLCSMQVIHIGGDLSITDVMTVLWQKQIKYDAKNPNSEFRDRFILSKGHASAVTAFNQAQIGCFSKEEIFKEYATDEGRFSMHSCRLINPFVDLSTGSLGHGMPMACGIAAGLRLKGNLKNRVYTIMGDGEQSEGVIWEATMNAAHYKLGNIVAILDYNKLEAFDTIDNATGLGNIADKYRVCGWNVVEINGNNIQEILVAFETLPDPKSDIPTIIICHTIKGCGVDFMENNVRWHAGKISENEYKGAVEKLGTHYNEKWGGKKGNE